MSKVVVKGESVYQCDTCSRKLRVPTNKTGMDVLIHCNITHGCQGKLHRLIIAKEISDTPAISPEVSGIQDWFQRKILYTHTQTVQAATWLIKHNLNNKPIIQLYVNRIINGIQQLVNFTPTTVITVDSNTTKLIFDIAVSGVVQCIALASQNSTNPNATDAVPASEDIIQLTNEFGELTIATLESAPFIGVKITYYTSLQIGNIIVEYPNIDNITSIDSPWVGARFAIINGKRYTIRSFNLLTTPLGPSYFDAGSIPNGSAFKLTFINNQTINIGDCLILLGNAPFASVDRNTTQYVDVSTISDINPESFYTNGRAYITPNATRTTYPAIMVI